MSRRALPVLDDPAEALPALQARWLEAVLRAPLPREEGATCADCAMLEGAGLRFSPETRCCTFLPALPNFLVGGGLREGGAAARSLRERMATGAGLSPLGLMVSAEEVAARVDPARFGQDPSAVCPHHEPATGRCAVWRWREASCATWYCKHTRGARSKALWNRVHQFLSRLERAVAWHAAVTLEIPAEGLAAMTPLDRFAGAPRADVVGDVVDLDALWGPWVGRVEDYFVACATLAEALPPAAVLALAGPEARAMAAGVNLGAEALRGDDPPARLHLGSARVVGLEPDAVRLQGYSHLDPLRVPRALFDQLHHFDGRATEEARANATHDAGEEVPASALTMLWEWEILRSS
ncbi:MAG: hypothetical protein U0325_06850 [Polyangiales bacterium]